MPRIAVGVLRRIAVGVGLVAVLTGCALTPRPTYEWGETVTTTSTELDPEPKVVEPPRGEEAAAPATATAAGFPAEPPPTTTTVPAAPLPPPELSLPPGWKKGGSW